MNHTMQGVLLSVGVTGAVALLGALLVNRVSRRSTAMAAGLAPLVVVVALSAGVAAAARAMLVAEDNSTLVFVVLAGAPLALLVGVLLAGRVAALQRATQEAQERARVNDERHQTITWISHDLRTPLSGIRALSEKLHEGVSADPGRDLADIIRLTDRMHEMVSDAVALGSAHGETAASSTRVVVALDDLVSDAVAEVLPTAEARGIVIRAGVMDGGTVRADASLLTRALANIVRNAVAFSPPGAAVDVTTTRGRVAVVDACGGIDAADLARVCEPGWRADAARTIPGTGLGLAIARHVARDLGGEVTVTNQPRDAHGRTPGCVVTLEVVSQS